MQDIESTLQPIKFTWMVASGVSMISVVNLMVVMMGMVVVIKVMVIVMFDIRMPMTAVIIMRGGVWM